MVDSSSTKYDKLDRLAGRAGELHPTRCAICLSKKLAGCGFGLCKKCNFFSMSEEQTPGGMKPKNSQNGWKLSLSSTEIHTSCGTESRFIIRRNRFVTSAPRICNLSKTLHPVGIYSCGEIYHARLTAPTHTQRQEHIT